MRTDPVLELSGVRKTYGRTQALKGVDLTVHAGEVHGLLGKNGAGKSTLIKVIGGIITPDTGSVRVRGREVDLGSPSAALEHKISVVHQELALVPQMSIAENIQMGRWSSRRGLLDRKAMVEAVAPVLRRVGLDRDPEEKVEVLGMAERQLVEIAKALSHDVDVLLLDEPTSSLSEREAERLMELVRELRADGVAVIYVTHHLSEMLAITDRISIVRDGTMEPPIESASATERELARLMVGESAEVTTSAPPVVASEREPLLSVRGLCVGPRLKDVDLDVYPGELIAVFGLMGAGRTRLARALFALETWTAGEATLDGAPYRPAATADAISRGIGFVGEDRSAGLVPKMSVSENVVLASLSRYGGLQGWQRAKAKADAEDLVVRLGIKTESVDVPVSSLSGGNQQKVLLARWLCSGAKLLLLDDPVRGVDVGAKEEIFAELTRLVETGSTVMYLTSDAEEAQRLGHRILVMAGGRIVAELPPQTPEDSIVAAAGGALV